MKDKRFFLFTFGIIFVFCIVVLFVIISLRLISNPAKDIPGPHPTMELVVEPQKTISPCVETDHLEPDFVAEIMEEDDYDPYEDFLEELYTYDLWYLSGEDGEDILIFNAGEKVLYRSHEFRITAYCPCEICCGIFGKDRPKDEYGNDIVIGAIGARLTDNQSCAIDPNQIPYGSNVYVDNRVLKAMDCGGAVNGFHIDIYRSTHSAALSDPSACHTFTALAYWSKGDTYFSTEELRDAEYKLENYGIFNLNGICPDWVHTVTDGIDI